MSIISRTVWVLSFVSLFADVASEMLYPVMPIYLQQIGFSIVLIGLLEGLAEATAGLSKGYFGKLSDTSGMRVPFVRLGYLFSALSKPLMAVFTLPVWVFAMRTVDRLGKGVRTGARDAILSAESTPETKGRVFGLHRSMDTLGAVIGPAVALIYLALFPHHYQTLFYLAFIPGLASVAITYFIKEKKTFQTTHKKLSTISFFAFWDYWKNSSTAYKQLTGALLFFALVNSSDVFLLLKLKEAGIADQWVIGMYIFYNLVYAIFGYPLGSIADKIGFRYTLVIGLSFFTLVYFGMAFTQSLTGFIALFFLYGLYAAATESIAKAWITTISTSSDTATAVGTYTGFQSICTLAASLLAGWFWYQFNPNITFIVTGIGSLMVVVYLLLKKI